MIDIARNIALEVLYKMDESGAYSNIALDDMLKNNRKALSDRDVSLISQIVYGVTTWKLTLDEIIKKYSSIKLKKISIWIINILRMGIYQIIFLDKIPKSAAVNECVNLAKRYGHKASSGFVNAILRSFFHHSDSFITSISSCENRYFITLAGIPTTIAYGGTSCVTTALAPITAPFPIWTPCMTTAFAPIHTSFSIIAETWFKEYPKFSEQIFWQVVIYASACCDCAIFTSGANEQ